MNNLISLKNISKSFLNNKKITVLKKINYSFTQGKIYSLMGPSGSGKSTLLNILSMIDKPTNGTLTISNKVINFSETVNNDKIRSKKIGIIYQQNNLLSDFTALENVYLANLALTDKKYDAIDRAKIIIKKMAINFPNSPSVNDTYTLGTRTWKWTGNAWQLVPLTAGFTGSQGDIGFTGSQGDIGFTASIFLQRRL